jgi:hypothetical protein
VLRNQAAATTAFLRDARFVLEKHAEPGSGLFQSRAQNCVPDTAYRSSSRLAAAFLGQVMTASCALWTIYRWVLVASPGATSYSREPLRVILSLAFGLWRILTAVGGGGAHRLDYDLWYGVDAESFSRPRYDARGIGIQGPGRVQGGSGG